MSDDGNGDDPAGGSRDTRSAVPPEALLTEKGWRDFMHRDITLANDYRMELIKLLLAICAALFAFLVTFRPTLTTVSAPWSMWIGWAGLATSMLGGMGHMIGWDRFYMSYRDDRDKTEEVAKKRRARITQWRRVAMTGQYAGFAVGIIGVGLFAALNLEHAQTATPPAVAATMVPCPCVAAPTKEPTSPAPAKGASLTPAVPAPAAAASS